MASNTLRFDYSGIARHERRLAALSGPELDRVKTRTLSAISRRLPTEASRLISTEVLHLSTRKVRQQLSVRIGSTAGSDFVELRGSDRRLPLSDFGVSVSKRGGATARIWRDTGPYRYPHAFRHQSGGRAIWQRIPYSVQAGVPGKPGGLVHRLPIVQRKGPAIRRAVVDKQHGDIFPQLMATVRGQLRAEITRLLRVERR